MKTWRVLRRNEFGGRVRSVRVANQSEVISAMVGMQSGSTVRAKSGDLWELNVTGEQARKKVFVLSF